MGDMPTGSNMKAPLGWGVHVFILKSFRLARTSPRQLCWQKHRCYSDPSPAHPTLHPPGSGPHLYRGLLFFSVSSGATRAMGRRGTMRVS